VTTRSRRAINRLQLGPVVGHTDEVSARVWIQAFDDPARYSLRVQGAGFYPFVSTEGGRLEFNTGIAAAVGLRPEWQYRYSVLRLGRLIHGAGGSFRTMPQDSSMASLLFCAISCSSAEEDGLWDPFGRFVEDSLPQFVLMMGDQVYLDEDEPDVFEAHFESTSSVRRRAMAEKYRLNWSRDPVRRVLANVPTYMVWDDHDARDGWGSSAGDSPTLLARHPRGEEIFRKSTAYFEDARDVYWHFQGCHNPVPQGVVDPVLPNYIDGPVERGRRRAMPFVFRCGRLVVLVLDSRGERDAFREEFPVLGAEQWQFIDQVFANLPADVEALAVVTPTPIASIDPDGQVMKLMGDRTDDVEAFKRGDLEGLLNPKSTESKKDLLLAAAGARLTRLSGRPVNLGSFKVSNIDEARDQWSHKFSRPEQADLLRKTGLARLSNRVTGSPRQLMFLSGDIHNGCIFDVSVLKPRYKASSLTSSGISKVEGRTLAVGVFVDEDFAVAPGIRSTLREVVPDFNFGVVQVIPTGSGATLHGAVAHEGNAFALGVDLADLL
jgi:hypothetical protein